MTYEEEYLEYNKERYEKDLVTLKEYAKYDSVILEVGAYPYQFTEILRKEFKNVDITNDEEWDNKTKYDIILFNEVFEHIRNPNKIVRNINNSLKDDGILIMTTPNLYNISTYLKFILGRGLSKLSNVFDKEEQVGYLGHIREYSKKEIIDYMQSKGFILIRYRYRIVHKQRFVFQIIKYLIPCFRDNQEFIYEKA